MAPLLLTDHIPSALLLVCMDLPSTGALRPSAGVKDVVHDTAAIIEMAKKRLLLRGLKVSKLKAKVRLEKKQEKTIRAALKVPDLMGVGPSVEGVDTDVEVVLMASVLTDLADVADLMDAEDLLHLADMVSADLVEWAHST